MSVALHQSWTADQFLSWAEAQDGRFEFDGLRPVAMTGGTINHATIMRNLHRSLDARLRGSGCTPLGPDAGLVTMGGAVRYPDALVTCTKQNGLGKTVTSVVVVFEIVSPGNAGTDRITKVREYIGVPSILRYVIVESTSRGLLVLHRDQDEALWRAAAVTESETLLIPELDIEIPVAEFYENVTFEA